MRAVLVNSVYEDDNVFRQRSRCVVCVELTGGGSSGRMLRNKCESVFARALQVIAYLRDWAWRV